MDEFKNQFNSEEYELEDNQSQYFDSESGEILDSKDLTVFQKMKILAERMGYEINNPKKGCRKCYGRGYTGFEKETKSPIVCMCVYKEEDKQKIRENFQVQTQKLSRAQRRKLEKVMRRRMKRVNTKKIIEEMEKENKDVE